MATESSTDDGEVTACESGQFMEKLAVGSECLLFPKADVQIVKNRVKLGSAFGQKRSLRGAVFWRLLKYELD